MKKYILTLLVLFITNVIFAVKIGDVQDLIKPKYLKINGDEIIVVEDSTFSIHVYSLKTLKMKHKLGKKGKGPGEFKARPFISEVSPNYIMGCDWNKLIWFSREGKVIKEVVTNEPNLRLITPIKDHYAAVEFIFHQKTGDLDIVLVLLNSQFEKIKKIARVDKFHRVQFANQPRETATVDLLLHYIFYSIYDDKIFFANSQKGLYFDVFDHQGNHLYSIDKNDKVKKIKVDDAYKERLIDYVKLHDRAFYDKYDRNNFLFFTHLPAIKNFRISDKKIFVITYKEKDNMRELIVLDLKGKILNKTFLPLKSIKLTRIVGGIGGDTFTVHKGMLYELIENEKTKIWELHKTDLRKYYRKD